MLPALEQASTEFVAYVDDLIRERKGDPKDDLITKLIEAEEDGDRLTEEEMGHLVSAVLVGGRRHHPGAACPRHPPFRRASWAVVPARPEPGGARAGRGRGGPTLRADHPADGTDHARGHRLPRRPLPEGHRDHRVRTDGEPRPGCVRRR